MEMRPPWDRTFVNVMVHIQAMYYGILTTLLFWQQTAVALHELPVPTPMTEIGEQSRPTRTSTPWTTMPSRPRRSDAAGSEA